MTPNCAIDFIPTTTFLSLSITIKPFCKRVPSHLATVVDSTMSHKAETQSVADESTCNWYFLVDVPADNDFTTRLVNLGAVVQYSGIKNTIGAPMLFIWRAWCDEVFWLLDIPSLKTSEVLEGFCETNAVAQVPSHYFRSSW